jgi:hypothetical protein
MIGKNGQRERDFTKYEGKVARYVSRFPGETY